MDEFVTKEKIEKTHWDEPWNVRELALRLLAERDAYRKVAIQFFKDSKVVQENDDIRVPLWSYCENTVDGEALRLLKETSR